MHTNHMTLEGTTLRGSTVLLGKQTPSPHCPTPPPIEDVEVINWASILPPVTQWCRERAWERPRDRKESTRTSHFQDDLSLPFSPPGLLSDHSYSRFSELKATSGFHIVKPPTELPPGNCTPYLAEFVFYHCAAFSASGYLSELSSLLLALWEPGFRLFLPRRWKRFKARVNVERQQRR